MNSRLKKILKTSAFGLLLLFGVTSCSSETKYLDGEICGEASVNGDNAFSEIREYYCEQFVYEYNLTLVGEGKEYNSFQEAYSLKFIVNENNVLEEATVENYTEAHYIFTYYDEVNKDLVVNYANDKFEDDAIASKYLQLVDICANGESTSGKKFGYFNKISNLGYDADNGVTGNTVKSVKERMTAHSKACLVFDDNGMIDTDTNAVTLPKTTWKDAWNQGFLYGLFVYPMAALVNLFVTWFGRTGWAQVGAIIVVTVILKLAILAITFKSQSSTQKMQDVQPEILKIQAKYGPNPSPNDRQRMSMELMAVYRKYGVKPLAPFASMLLTFPIFIAMYRAVMYLAVLRTGNIGGVTLGDNLSSYFLEKANIAFPATLIAAIIFIMMAASQIMSMKLPQLLNRKRMSPEAKKQQKQMGMMTNIMMIMILVMGFMMPVTMSIYWVASAIVSMIQSIIMHKLNNGNKKGKYKVKKQERPITIPQGYKKVKD